MTFRTRALLPFLLLSVAAIAALVVMPWMARALTPADRVIWNLQYAGPSDYSFPVGLDDHVDVEVGAAFNAVSFSDASNGWAVGLRKDYVTSTPGNPMSFVARTTNGGSSWTTQSVPGSAYELNGVLALSNTNVWAVGMSGTIAHWNGAAWTVTPPLSGWSGKALRSIAFSGPNGWAVGDGLGIARTTDGGASWTTLRAPSGTASLRSVSAFGTAGTAIAVGDSGKIQFIDSSGAYARGSATSNNLYGVTFADASNVWAVGNNATIVRSSNGGSSWSAVVDLPLPPGKTLSQANIRAVAFAGTKCGMAVGQYQGTWRTFDGGITWSADVLETYPDFGNDWWLQGIAFPGSSPNAPVAVGRSINYAPLEKNDQKARAYLGSWSDSARADVLPPLTVSDAQAAYVGPATIHLSAIDPGGSGVAHTYSKLDGGAQVEGVTASTATPGPHTLEFWSVDVLGHAESPHKTVQFTITIPDTTAPSTVSDAASVYAGPATVHLTATDNPGGTGVAHTWYSLDGAPAVEGVTASAVTRGSHTLEFWSVDVAENEESPHKTATFMVHETTPPTTTSDVKATAYDTQATITLIATDDANGSGVDRTLWRLDGGPETQGTTILSSVEGTHTMEFWSVDNDGNVEPHKTASFSIGVPVPPDTAPPTTTSDAKVSYVGPATIALSSADDGGSGVAHTYFTLDGAARTEGVSVYVAAAGSHTLKFWSVDVAENPEAQHSVTFTVTYPDTTAPVTTSDVQAEYLWTAEIRLTPTDLGGSTGTLHTYWKLDDGAQTEGRIISTSVAGQRTLEYWSIDGAGNAEVHKTATFVVTAPAASTDETAPITTGPGASLTLVAGSKVTLTATDSDGIGVAGTRYRLDGGEPTTGTVLTFGKTGARVLEYWSVDKAGNEEPHHVTAITVLYATKLTITSNRTSVTHRHAVTFSGTISSTRPKNTHVVVYKRRYGSSSWTKLSTRNTTSTHRWSYTYYPPTKGTWIFQARVGTTSTSAASVSSERKISVK